MNYRAIFAQLGRILVLSATFYIFPVLVAICYGEFSRIPYFLIALAISVLFGSVLVFFSQKQKKIHTKEGLVIVGLSWILISAIGALPLCLSGVLPNYIDAFFEMVSGFTTTGASVLTDFNIAKCMHFWRAFSHWLGGMGILVFMLAVLPSHDASAFQLMKFESPGPQVGKMVSKVRFTATILYVIYFCFTVIEFLFLVCGGLDVYNSLIVSMSTAGTGGFAATAGSIKDFNSLYVEIVVTVFMFIFSVNFNLYYLIILKKFWHVLRDEELHFYFLYVVVGILLITLNNTLQNPAYKGDFFKSLRYSAFGVLTITSTTGFVSADFALWPLFSQILLLILMLFGSMAGSTGGGLKASRILILFKSGRADSHRILRPHGLYCLQMNKKELSSELVASVKNYFVLAFSILAVSVVLVSLDGGVDFLTAISACVTCFSNVGPGLGSVIGPTGSFASLSSPTKLLLSLDMLLGRLEIFPILLLFSVKTWSKRY